jgi:two-component system, chemotaxis family, chemotaxis protein CheY
MKRIMTIDDSPSLRQMVALTLESQGYEVIEAADGNDAVSKLGDREFHLFLTDLNMPGMDGIELTRKLRSMSSYRFVPILLLTTESDQTKKMQGKAAGATGWIVKPFRPEDLLATIKKVLR